MKYLLILSCLLFSVKSYALNDFVTVEQMFKYYSNESTKNLVLSYIRGVGDGIVWREHMSSDNEICLSNDKSFNADEFYVIYKSEYYRNEKYYDSEEYQPAGLLILNGLIYTYPCNK